MTAEEVNDMIRALNPDPGAYLMIEGKRFKIWKAEIASDSSSLNAGSVVANKGRFAISFADNSVLNLLEVQPSGKKRMDIKSFLNGQGSKFVPGEEIVDR